MLEIVDVLVIVLATSFLLQLAFHWAIFARLAFYKPKTITSSKLPVSVVIVARNEYENLLHSLVPILNQDYPEFEVVVVNDQSDDDSHYFLKELNKKYKHLKLVQIDQSLNFFRGKKFPLSIGIKSATYNTLLLTDADCFVDSPLWISKMQAAFEKDTEIVLGYGPYRAEPGFLNKIIRFDAFMAALHYLSFALIKMPYMGVGRNLAYSKAMFYQKHGFINHYKINSGDDDLFINEAATKTNTCISIDPESYTYSIPEKRLGAWIMQKKRHLSTSSLYKLKHKIFLMFYPLSLFAFYSIAILLLCLNSWKLVVLILFSMRLISFFILQKSALQKLKERKLLLISPILELLIYTIQGLVMTMNIFNRNNKWK